MDKAIILLVAAVVSFFVGFGFYNEGEKEIAGCFASLSKWLAILALIVWIVLS
jgi:hypothetical protein